VTAFSSRDDGKGRSNEVIEIKKGVPLRHDEKSAEVIDKERFVIRPLCRYGCKLLKRKGLKTERAKAEKAQKPKKKIGGWRSEAQYE
jgi:hypothetical protein